MANKMSKRIINKLTVLLLTTAFLFSSGCNSFFYKLKEEPSEKETTTDTNVSSVSEDDYTEKDLTLFTSFEGMPDTIKVRFYDKMPSVPFIGLAQYKKLIQNETLKVENDGNCLKLTAGNGAFVIADPDADTLTSDRWAEFRNNPEGINSDKVVGFRDFNVPFVRIESIEYEPQKEPLVFDFSGYEIPLYTDSQDVYLPLAMVNDLMTDVATTTLAYNEENLYLYDYDESFLIKDNYPEYYKRFVDGTPRDPDMAEYAYHQLCFNMDKLYGCPGSSVLDKTVADIGFDRALKETDEITSGIRDMLLSTDRDQYNIGLFLLFYYFYDGHTTLSDDDIFSILMEKDQEWIETNIQKHIIALQEKDYYDTCLQNLNVTTADVSEAREAVFGDTLSYHEQGDTAVISIDNYMDYDEKGWASYYRGEGPMPDGDIVGKVVSGIERAKENPEIKNIILDVSNNTGGSSDLMMTVIALITGKAEIKCYDRTTDQYFTIRYVIDSRFDGSFDTSAYYDENDFNYAILTTHNSFSCGNATPSIAKDDGLPIFGETSGGGTCMIRFMAYPEGPVCQISSSFGLLVNSAGDFIEDGVPVDADLVKVSDDGTNDYTGLYDIDVLSDLMAERYETALPDAA